MWINEFTDRQVEEAVKELKNLGSGSGWLLRLFYIEVKRLNLIINKSAGKGNTSYSTSATVDEETRKQLEV